MRLTKLLIVLLFVSCSSKGQQSCQLNDILKAYLISDIPYSIDKDYVDLTDVFQDNRTPYIGFIGENKEKLDFHILSIEQDETDTLCYQVKAEVKVYAQPPKLFEGDFILEKQYRFSTKLDEDVVYADEILKQGFSILSYKLKEKGRVAGVLGGNILVFWYLDVLDKVNYDDTLDYYPSYSNCLFWGLWKDNSSPKDVLTAWGQYRVPCSWDLDVGVAEFMPNEKYYKYGWSNYKL